MLIEDIQLEINQWKRKGMTPSTLRINPSLITKLQVELNTTHTPVEVLGLKIIEHPCPLIDKGFFCTGPWYYNSREIINDPA